MRMRCARSASLQPSVDDDNPPKDAAFLAEPKPSRRDSICLRFAPLSGERPVLIFIIFGASG